MKALNTIPRATYRLQLNRDFTFRQATDVVPYLSALGISHCYISPCLKARAGSLHGYDIVDHNSFNAEIGSAEDFDSFVAALHQHNMGLILDVVPNHMGVMGSDNAWWLDVLENGESSAYANFFDIDWRPLKDELYGKVLVPVLGDHYGVAIENGELKLVFNVERGEFDIFYYEHRFPVDPREYPRILQHCSSKAADTPGEANPDVLELQSLVTAFGHLPERHEVAIERMAERSRDKEINKRRLSELCARSPDIAACIQRAVTLFNGNPSNPESFEDLHELVKAQAFRLANWRVASDDINYRRFFDTNDLAGIRMENEAVFEATHRLVLRLMSEGKVDGLRLDHPDGLYDPAQYFERLRRGIAAAASSDGGPDGQSAPPADVSRYVVIEKILTGSEKLPSNWAISGTTGYDFSNLVNGLFVDSAAGARLERVYRNFIDDDTGFEEVAYRCRRLIMRFALASELNVLANRLTRIALAKRRTCDFTLNSLRDALMEVASSFPVYRTYVSPSGVSKSDIQYIRAAISTAKWRSPAADTSIFDFISEVLLTHISEGQDPNYQNAVMAFAMKFQQFTSPVMAKGIEDTVFYRYNRLMSLNDVGSDPRRLGVTAAEFHAANEERLRSWPHTMLATSTHDSKRSEDVRARINVISEIPALWRLRVRDWKRFNRKHTQMLNHRPAPTPNDEYLLYQTLLGAWPLEPLESNDNWVHFSERMQNYMIKAIREAKQNTSWINQNSEYETAVSSFVRAVLSQDPRNKFLDDFLPFQRRVARVGMWNSLSQTLLKLTCPGVPDIYQGTDLWDFSLVDPDNRRPVDYDRRRQAFESFRATQETPDQSEIASLLQSAEDGRIKLFLKWKTLCLRRQHPELFEKGAYVPIEVEGAKASHVIVFARRNEGATVVVVVPRLIAGLLQDADTPPIGPQVWEDTGLSLPFCGCRDRYQNVFTGEIMGLEAPISLANVLANFPVALFVLR